MITAWKIFVDKFSCVEFTIYVKMHQEILMTKFLNYLYCVVFFSKPKETWKQWSVDGRYALQVELEKISTDIFWTRWQVFFYLCWWHLVEMLFVQQLQCYIKPPLLQFKRLSYVVGEYWWSVDAAAVCVCVCVCVCLFISFYCKGFF